MGSYHDSLLQGSLKLAQKEIQDDFPMTFFEQYLVGGFNSSEKILVNWEDYSQYMGN